MKLLKMQTLMCLSSYIRRSVADNGEGKAAAAVVKIIKWDGVVIIYRRSIKASELMMQFPKHLVCDSQSFYIGQKVPPLDPRDKLHLGRNYFLLPMDAFQSVLSLVSVASAFAAFKLRLSSTYKAISSFQAFDVMKAPSGYLQIRVTDEFISKLTQLQQQKLNNSPSLKGGILCSTPQLSKEYSQLVVSSHLWKPKLEIIKESKKKRLPSSSFRMMKRSNTSKPSAKLKRSQKKVTAKVNIRTK